MSNSSILDLFFKRIYEKDIHEKFLDDISFAIPYDSIKNYIANVIKVPYAEFIDYLGNHVSLHIFTSKDITQCSSLSACMDEMCLALLEDDNRPKSFIEIGQSKIFEKYVSNKNVGAWRKYGENQVKTAEQLGLAFEYYGGWYLSALGYVYRDLDEETKNCLLSRTLLRTPLYADIVSKIMSEDIYLSKYMTDLSPSTQGRRSGSVLKLLRFCLDEMNKEGLIYHDFYYPKCRGVKGYFNDLYAGNFKHIDETYTINKKEVSSEYLAVAETPGKYSENKNVPVPTDVVKKYQNLFSEMKMAHSKGKKAPHKIILLLAVLSLIEKGELLSNKIVLTVNLQDEYNFIWSHYVNKDSQFTCNIAMPFWHMKSEPFWTMNSNDGTPLDSITNKYSVKELRVRVSVLLDPALFEILQDSVGREFLKKYLFSLLKQ